MSRLPALVLALLPVTACGSGSPETAKSSPSPSPVRHTLTGTLRISGANGELLQRNEECAGSSGYSDVRGGASVTVTDGEHRVIGVSQLAGSGWGRLEGRDCIYDIEPIEVPEVPFYGVEVANRGAVR